MLCRKIICAMLAMLLIVSLCACGAGEPSTAESQPQAAPTQSGAPADSSDGGAPIGERTRQINFVGSVRRYPGEEDAWNQVVSAFEDENSDVKVNVRWQGQWDEVPQNLSAAKMSGEPVDLFTAGGGVINSTLAMSGSLMDMTELMAPYLDRYNEGMLSAYYIGDKLWGIPFGDADLSVVYYNKIIFDELALTPPKTFDEMVAIAEIIRSQKNIMPMIHQGAAVHFWPMWFMETYAQTSGNKSVANVNEFLSGKLSFDNAETAEAFTKIKAFLDSGILTQESLSTDGDGVRAAMAQGKAAMFYGGTWEYNPLLSAVGSNGVEIGVFEFPQVIPGATPQHGGGPSDALVIPSFASQDNLDVTMRFIEFITRSENANIILKTYSPNVAIMQGIETVDTPIKTALNDSVRPHTIAFLDWIWPAEINDAVVQAIPAVIAGQMTPEEAAASLQTALERLKEEKEYQFDWWTAWTPEQWASVTPQNIPPAIG